MVDQLLSAALLAEANPEVADTVISRGQLLAREFMAVPYSFLQPTSRTFSHGTMELANSRICYRPHDIA